MKKQNQNQDSKLTVYELGYLLDSKFTEDQAAAKASELGTFMSQDSGAVISSGEPKMRNLAYQMTIKREGKRRDFNKAYFGWVKFEQDPDMIGGLEAKIKLDQDLVRYLLIKTIREDIVPHATDDLTDAEMGIEEDDVEIEDEIEDEIIIDDIKA